MEEKSMCNGDLQDGCDATEIPSTSNGSSMGHSLKGTIQQLQAIAEDLRSLPRSERKWDTLVEIISGHMPRTALGLTSAAVILCGLLSLLLFLATGTLLLIIPTFMLGGFIIVATAGCLIVLLGSTACIFGTLTIMSIMLLCGVIVSRVGFSISRSAYNFLCDVHAKPNFIRLTNDMMMTKKAT